MRLQTSEPRLSGPRPCFVLQLSSSILPAYNHAPTNLQTNGPVIGPSVNRRFWRADASPSPPSSVVGRVVAVCLADVNSRFAQTLLTRAAAVSVTMRKKERKKKKNWGGGKYRLSNQSVPELLLLLLLIPFLFFYSVFYSRRMCDERVAL